MRNVPPVTPPVIAAVVMRHDFASVSVKELSNKVDSFCGEVNLTFAACTWLGSHFVFTAGV